MNELSKTRLFRLLAEPSQVTNEEMQNAYGDFMKHIEAVSTSGDYATIHRMLNITRIELSFLESLNQYEQGKKCPEKSVSTKNTIYF